MKFDNTYGRLPARFYQRIAPVPVKNFALIGSSRPSRRLRKKAISL